MSSHFKYFPQVFKFLLIAVLGLLAYVKSFSADFVFDDIPVILGNSYIHNLDQFKNLFFFDPTRFVTHFTFALNYHFSGPNVFSFHGVNLALHVLCAWFVYILIEQTLHLLSTQRGQNLQHSSHIALFSALIFLVHPLQTESVTYIVQRSTEIATLCYLVSLILYLRLRQSFTGVIYLLCWVFIIIGCMAKPIFITIPCIVLLYERIVFKSSMREMRSRTWLYLPYCTVVAVIPILLTMFSSHYYGEAFSWSNWIYATRISNDISRWDYLLTQSHVLWTYVRLLLIPLNQNLDYDYPIHQNLLDGSTALCIGGLIAILSCAVIVRKKYPIISFSLAWFFIVLIPESSIFPLPDFIFEHRLYMAIIGFALCVCIGVAKFVKNEKHYIVLKCFVIINFGFLKFFLIK